jgi:P27 family predicted phage terminase small subunit
MGERGPVPIPYARRRNPRRGAGRHVDVLAPEMPDGLCEEAEAEWLRVVPELEAIGLLATVDRAVLIRYCQAWADWHDLNGKLAATGPLIKGRRDALVRNPLWLLRRDAEETLSDLGKQLGLTPASRLRQGVTHDLPEDDDHAVGVAAIAEYRKMLGLEESER